MAKTGRPRLYPGTEKRPTLTFRVRDRMHEQLSRAAEESGRSLSEEIEHRLAASSAMADTRQIIAEEVRAAVREAMSRDRTLTRLAELDAPLLGLPGPSLQG